MTQPSPAPVEQGRQPSGRGDLISGAVTAAFGAGVLVYVQGFPDLPDGAPGPALFPEILGALFVLFGLTLLVRYARDRGTPVPEADPEDFQSLLNEPISPRAAWTNALSVLGSIVFYLVAVNLLGFSLTLGLLLAALMWRLGAGLRVAVASSVVTTAVIYVLFERVLLVPLPTGFLG